MGRIKKGKLVISCKSSQGSPIGQDVITDELEYHDENIPKIFDTNERLTKNAKELIKKKNEEGYTLGFFEEKPSEE